MPAEWVESKAFRWREDGIAGAVAILPHSLAAGMKSALDGAAAKRR
jgi:hypothetical protein